MEQYCKFNPTQRKKVKRDELQAMLDEHIQSDGEAVASIRGIIREELNTKLEAMKTELSNLVKSEVKTVADENKRLADENATIKKVLSEHQKFMERSQRELSKNNIFISGIPNAVQPDFQNIANADDENAITNHVDIVHHILNFVSPGIDKESYQILKNFDAKENHTRHSAKIQLDNYTIRYNIFKGCTKFKDLDGESYLKKIFLKNDDPPLTRKEHERLHIKMKELREQDNPDDPHRYYIKKRDTVQERRSD